MLILLALVAVSQKTVQAQSQAPKATLELFQGAEANDLERVKRAIHAGGDVLARNTAGQRASDIAADLDHMAVAHYILSMRPRVKVQPAAAVPRQQRTPIKPARPVKPVAVVKPIAMVKPVVAVKPVIMAKPIEKPRPVAKTKPVAVPQPVLVKTVLAKPAPAAPVAFNFFGNRIALNGKGQTRCIEKPGDIRVCLQPLNWPAELKTWFDVDTVYYDGLKSIVMFEKGQLKQIHVLFRRDGFKAVSAFLKGQLNWAGQASVLEHSTDTQAYLGKDHRIIMWTGLKGSWPDSLEVRELDSLRWSALPDEKHGVVRVFRKGEAPLFKHVSSADFMLGFLTAPAKSN